MIPDRGPDTILGLERVRDAREAGCTCRHPDVDYRTASGHFVFCPLQEQYMKERARATAAKGV